MQYLAERLAADASHTTLTVQKSAYSRIESGWPRKVTEASTQSPSIVLWYGPWSRVGPVGVELPSWCRWTFASCALCSVRLSASGASGSPFLWRLPPTIGRREAMFWTASDTIISCRGRSSVDEPTHPSPLRTARGGQARHWTRERQTRQRTPLVAAGTGLEPTRPISAGLGSWLCRDLRRVKGHRSSACRRLENCASDSQQRCHLLPTCDPRAPKSRSMAIAPCRPLRRWEAGGRRPVLCYGSKRARRQPWRGCDAVELRCSGTRAPKAVSQTCASATMPDCQKLVE